MLKLCVSDEDEPSNTPRRLNTSESCSSSTGKAPRDQDSTDIKTLPRDDRQETHTVSESGAGDVRKRPRSESDKNSSCHSAKEETAEKRPKISSNVVGDKDPVLNVDRRTAGISLEDARARFLARKSSRRVPVSKDDSD